MDLEGEKKRLNSKGVVWMDNYKRVENLLRNYRTLKDHIEIKKKELEELEPDGVSAIELEERTSKTYKINDPVFQEAVAMEKEKEKIKKQIKKKEKIIGGIDFALEKLDYREREIIKLRYIEGKQWWQVGAEVHYSPRWCKEIRTEAINKMAVIIYGDTSLLLPFYFPFTSRHK